MNAKGVPNGTDGYCHYPDCVFAGRTGHTGKNYVCRYYEIMGCCKTPQLPKEKRNDGNCYFYQSDEGVDLDEITAPYGDTQISMTTAFLAGKTDSELARLFHVSVINVIKWREKHGNAPNHKSAMPRKAIMMPCNK